MVKLNDVSFTLNSIEEHTEKNAPALARYSVLSPTVSRNVIVLEHIDQRNIEWPTKKVETEATFYNDRRLLFTTLTYIRTYIIDHYNTSVRISGKASHTTHVACVNFIQEWRDLQFNVNSERQIF